MQPTAITVQGVLLEAIGKFTQTDPSHISIMGSGRTDAGVHALGQVAHVDFERSYTPHQVREGINSHLRKHRVCVVEVSQISSEFHARFSALRRSYRYRVLNRRAPPSYEHNKVWHCPVNLDRDAMQEAIPYFQGLQDFTSFRASLCQATNPIRSLESITLIAHEDELHLNVSARAFLHHQVRNIMGTLMWVGKGKFKPQDIPGIFAARNRSAAGPTAPPYGLCFMKVDYPEVLIKTWQDGIE